jgi:hypothetical protein
MGPTRVFIREQGWKLREMQQLHGQLEVPKENPLPRPQLRDAQLADPIVFN